MPVDTADPCAADGQDFHRFLDRYRRAHPDDVLAIAGEVSGDQEITAVVDELAAENRHPVLVFERVAGVSARVVTNVFASRERVARLLGCAPREIHASYQARARAGVAPRVVERGPVLDSVESGAQVDIGRLPLLKHFETDRERYVTNAVILAEHPDTGAGNLSYHRSMPHSKTALATSLHSRGDLWRLLGVAAERQQKLPIAMVIGMHPLFMLAASARVPYGTDERDIAGGLLGAPLEVVRTPRHGLRVPAHAEIVLEGTIDPTQQAEEGPFGEFTGYSSDRSTNNLFEVETVLRRQDAILVDVVGGRSAEHLNLARIPRESEMAEKLRERFPSVTALHYPTSGTHFHAYVALKPGRAGEARQVMLGLLGWDPYLKTVVAVDPDVDVTQDEQVLWALATHFQPHRDVLVIDGLPGSALDPSSSAAGTTSRMGLDATRKPGFDAVKATVSEAARARARTILSGLR
jgi:4-hydroxy-3-polyprenylbenzoate decarboxylase